MKAIDIDGVQPGDILLTARPDKLGGAIQRATGGEVSHAMICVQLGSFIDSTRSGVQASNLQRELFEDDEVVYQFRLLAPAAPETIAKIVNYARSEIGARYSLPDAVRTVVPLGRGPSRRQFCSRLVARAYAQAGIRLLSDTEFCSPEDLRNSPMLVQIPITMRTVSEGELQWRNSAAAPIAAMHAAQKDLLKAVRLIDNKVETMEDILSLVRDRGDVDEQVDMAQGSSGYLDVWRMEIEAHPWRYQPGLIDADFETKDNPSLRDYCIHTVREAYTGGIRYSQNLVLLRRLNDRVPRQSFRSQIELYATLERNHQSRREIAYTWLSKHFPSDLRGAMEEIEPHSEHWYSIVDVVAPALAAGSRIATGATHDAKACSICGDIPALAVRLVNGAETLNGVPSARLCGDCLEIRVGMGEVWMPFLR